jgi:AAA domain
MLTILGAGNEEHHIIVSVVRSDRPGFLKNERRMNVMLSRCKASMIICSSKAFLHEKNISSTLVGKLARECAERSGPGAWITMEQIKGGRW